MSTYDQPTDPPCGDCGALRPRSCICEQCEECGALLTDCDCADPLDPYGLGERFDDARDNYPG